MYTISEYGFRMSHERTMVPDARTFVRHAHVEYELLYFISGQADCIVEHLRHTLEPGELVLIPPMAYHMISMSGTAAYERLVIDFDACGLPTEYLNRVFDHPRVIHTPGSYEMRDVLARMDLSAKRYTGETQLLMARTLTAELVCLIDTAQAHTRNFTGVSRVMEKAMTYIDEHIESVTGIDELCTHLFISRAYLHRQFQTTLGISPMRYIMDKRLFMAQKRLRLGEKPTQVCTLCGFGDYSAFYRAYKANFGITPGEELSRREASLQAPKTPEIE